jgi:hypothetical protein
VCTLAFLCTMHYSCQCDALNAKIIAVVIAYVAIKGVLVPMCGNLVMQLLSSQKSVLSLLLPHHLCSLH